MNNIKKNLDIILFFTLHCIIFLYLITGVKYFPLDLPTVMKINMTYGVWGIFSTSAAGRYWPLSQFISSLVTQFGGDNIIFQWITQYLLFIIVTLLAWRVAWLLCRDRKAAFGAVLLCICATPMSENVFTIGKPEITLSVMILTCLVLMLEILFKHKSILFHVLFLFFSYLAFISKETSIIILPLLVLFCIFIFCFRLGEIKTITALILECFVAYAIYFLVKSVLVQPETDSYVSYELNFLMILESIKYYLKYCWDIILIGLLSLITCVINLCKQVKYDEKQEQINRMAFSVILNIVGWGYLAGICLWRFRWVYYAFPSVIFFAGPFAVSLQQMKTKKKGAIACFGILIAIALIYGGWNGYLVSAATRDVSSMFSESIDFLLLNDRITGKIYVENYSFFEESPYQINNLFDLYGKNLEAVGIKEFINQNPPSDEQLHLYGYTREDYLEKACLNGPRVGDYILLYENRRNNWVPSRKTNPSNEGEEKLEQYGLILERIAGNQIKKTRRSYSLKGILKAEEITGWTIYEIIGCKNGIDLNTEWEDWLGETNTVVSVNEGGYARIVLEGAYDHTFSDLKVNCQTDGRTVPCILIINDEENRYQLTIDIKDVTDSNFAITICFSNSFIPSQFYADSNDHRKLTLRVPDTLYMAN